MVESTGSSDAFVVSGRRPGTAPASRPRGVTIDTTHLDYQTASRSAPPVTAATDERHVRARILHDAQARETFVAGAANVIYMYGAADFAPLLQAFSALRGRRDDAEPTPPVPSPAP